MWSRSNADLLLAAIPIIGTVHNILKLVFNVGEDPAEFAEEILSQAIDKDDAPVLTLCGRISDFKDENALPSWILQKAAYKSSDIFEKVVGMKQWGYSDYIYGDEYQSTPNSFLEKCVHTDNREQFQQGRQEALRSEVEALIHEAQLGPRNNSWVDLLSKLWLVLKSPVDLEVRIQLALKLQTVLLEKRGGAYLCFERIESLVFYLAPRGEYKEILDKFMENVSTATFDEASEYCDKVRLHLKNPQELDKKGVVSAHEDVLVQLLTKISKEDWSRDQDGIKRLKDQVHLIARELNIDFSRVSKLLYGEEKKA